MVRATFPFITIVNLVSIIGCTRALVGNTRDVSEAYSETCQKIANSTSKASAVYDAESVQYQEDIHHWAWSSAQPAACSFEPGTPEDVGIALRILGQTQIPFAVKGGGHTANPGFSSTPGVQIAMSRFSEVVYDTATQTVAIGAGQIWDNVYTALEPHGRNVVGGRVSGVGVAGFTLGGGYSWFTNQYGLTIDTVQAFELVMPNGTVADVTETSSPDLFFALKGGLNNFGIVTRFTLKTFPQSQVWGGVLFYPAAVLCTLDDLDRISQATANFAASVTDPKAAIITAFNYFLGVPQPTVLVFYDAPTPPPGIFDEFLEIFPPINDIATRPFPSFVQSIPTGPVPIRGIFNSIPVKNYPLSFLRLIVNESSYWAENLLPESVFFVNYDVEPFLPTLYTHNTSPSAYPPDRTQALLPLEIYFAWKSQNADQVVQDVVRKSAQTLQAHAIDGGLSDANAAVYSNYAIFDTPLVKLYGTNLPRLQAIKKAVDPDNVMGLAGGFKL